MNKTEYVLVHRITKKRLLIPNRFETATEAIMWALCQDLHAEPIPIAFDPRPSWEQGAFAAPCTPAIRGEQP